MERYLADQTRTLAGEMADVRRARRGRDRAASQPMTEASAAERTRMKVLHGRESAAAGRYRGGSDRRRNTVASPGRRKSEAGRHRTHENRTGYYNAGPAEQYGLVTSPGRRSGVGQRGARRSRADHHLEHSTAHSPGRRQLGPSGRSKAASAQRMAVRSGQDPLDLRGRSRQGDTDGSSAVSIPLVDDRPPIAARGRDGWPQVHHSRTAVRLAHSKTAYDTMWAAMENEAAVLVQKNYRGYRGRQRAAQEEARLRQEQEEQNALLERLRRQQQDERNELQERLQQEEQNALQERLRLQQQEERAERIRRVAVQREHMEEQRHIMDQRRRVRQEAAEVEREIMRLQQASLQEGREALAAEREMLAAQRQKLAAAKQQTVRPATWNDYPTDAHSIAQTVRMPSGWERTEYSPAREVAHSVDTAAENAMWPLNEGVPPASPAVENRIASLEQQFSQITDVLTSSSRGQSVEQTAVLRSSKPSRQKSLQHEHCEQNEQYDHRLQRPEKQGTVSTVESVVHAMPPQPAAADATVPKPEPEPEPEPEHTPTLVRTQQPVRVPTSTRQQQQHQPQAVQVANKEHDVYELERQQQEEQAAVLLQKTYRGYRGRQSADEFYEQLLLEQQEEDEAATKLQAAWRGSATRRDMALMQDESPREKAWALFGGSGRGGPSAAKQAVSPRTQVARRNQFLQVGNSAGGSVLLGTAPQDELGVETSHSGDDYSQTTESTWATVCPEDLFADADVAGDGVIVASQVRQVLLDMAPELGRTAPPTDEAFVADLMQAFGKRYRVADGSVPEHQVVIGLDIDAFCAMWEHITGSSADNYDSIGSDSELSSAQTTSPSFYSEVQEEGGYSRQDARDQKQPTTTGIRMETRAQEHPTERSVAPGKIVSGMGQAVVPPSPRLSVSENDTYQVLAPARDHGNTGHKGSAGDAGTDDSGLKVLMEEGAAISIQATWRGRRTANALAELRSLGMTDADIRWMVQQGHHLAR